MDESHSSEVERVLLHVGHARDRARRAVATVAKSGAEPHVISALERAADELGETYRRLSQGTYYAVSPEEMKLAV